MNKPMRLLNATLIVIFVIGVISSVVLSKATGSIAASLGGLAFWLVTLGSAFRVAGGAATKLTKSIAWWANIVTLVLMAFAVGMMLFTADQKGPPILLAAIFCTPIAFNVYWLRRMRSEAQEDYDEPDAPAAPALPLEEEEAPEGNYVARHWRGQLSLPVSYWVNGTLLGIALLLLFTLIGKLTRDIELRIAALLALAMLTITIVISVWSTVGIWRSAGKHASRGGSASWAALAQLMMILGTLGFGVRFVTEFGPQMREYASIASGRDEIGIVKAELASDGRTLLLQGSLGTGSSAEVAKILSVAPGVRVLMLNSNGGRLWEAEQLAKMVRERKLDTYVEGQCESACTFVFLAGVDRAATPNARIGFHQPSFAGKSAEGAGLSNMIEVYRTAGISESFLAKVRATPSQSMWYPTRDELIDNGVINRMSLGGETASWSTIFRSKEDLALAFRETPIIRAIEARFPGTLQQAVDAAWARREHGAVDAEITAEIRGVIATIYPKLLAVADDAGLDEFLDLFVDQIVAARRLGPEACGLFLDAKLDGSKTLPRDLMERESEWSMKQLQASSNLGRPVSLESFQSALEPVFANMTGEQVDVISAPESYEEQNALRCEAFVTFYGQIRELPDRERWTVMRGMYQSPELQ